MIRYLYLLHHVQGGILGINRSTKPPRTEMEKQLLRPTETAEALGISRSRVYELLASGAIESISIGRSRRIPVDAVHRFVADRVAESSQGGQGTPMADSDSRRRGVLIDQAEAVR